MQTDRYHSVEQAWCLLELSSSKNNVPLYQIKSRLLGKNCPVDAYIHADY